MCNCHVPTSSLKCLEGIEATPDTFAVSMKDENTMHGLKWDPPERDPSLGTAKRRAWEITHNAVDQSVGWILHAVQRLLSLYLIVA